MSATGPHREIERRFLLRQAPALAFERVLHIRQFYTARDPRRGYVVRFRRIAEAGGAVTASRRTRPPTVLA